MRYLIIILLFASCNPLKKAQQTFDANKPAAAEYCADRFPVKDTLIIGDTIVRTDTLETFEVFVDTTTIRDTMYITRTLPGKTITRTVTRIDTVRRRDFAYENVLADQVRQCSDLQLELVNKNTRLTEQVDEWKGKARKRSMWLFILIGAIGAYGFLRLKKLIPF